MNQDVYTKQTKFGVFYSNRYPQDIKNGLIACVLVNFGIGVFFLVKFSELIEEFIGWYILLTSPFFIAGCFFIRQLIKLDKEYDAFLREVKQIKANEKAYRKEHEDELFYNECVKNGIHTTNAADIARMKIIAKQMDIVCSDDELHKKYLKGKSNLEEQEKIAAEKERKARILVLRKEEKLAELEGKKYIHLVGSDKRVKMCLDIAAGHRANMAQYKQEEESFLRGTEALYSLYAGKEKDWAVHGGMASAIAGGAAGVAVAADIQRKNAEIRASNDRLSQSIGQLSAEHWKLQSSAISHARETMEKFEAKAEKAKLKLVEYLPQDDLLKLLSPVLEKTTTSETGAITFTVSINKASLTIYETVKAVVDGAFKIKIMDGNRLAGEAYFTLPYCGSDMSQNLTSICTAVPEEHKEYTFVFAPHNLFAIEQ